MSVAPVATRPSSSGAAVPAGRWLSLGPASRLVGVDPDTLRRWADEGRVEVFVTPGGHRRFDRRALEGLASTRRAAPASLARLGTSQARLARAYRRAYASEASGRHEAGDEADRDRYRREGRRLIETLIAHLDAERADRTTRRDAEVEALALVDGFARRLRERGMSLTESTALFVAARRPFLAELAGIGRRRTLDAATLGELYHQATDLLDRLLVRFITTYQETGD